MAATSSDTKDNLYNDKPPVFDGEKFDYWKDKIKSFFLGFDFELWELVTEGYEEPKNAEGNAIPLSQMTDLQKKNFKNHYRARTILLNSISYLEYEKITNKETAKSIYDSLVMTHEGNNQVKETKALALLQKYEAFKMEDNESVEKMFSRFQILVAGLKVLNKGYNTADHVKKIIRSLPSKWRPMVTTLKVAKDLNSVSLEELICSLRSQEIELQADEPQRKVRSVALKSNFKKDKALQAEEESEESDEESSDEDELSLISKRINKLWKHRQSKFRGSRRAKGRFEYAYGQKKNVDKGNIICYECKEPRHYKNECPKLKKDKKFAKKKGLMATWDDSDSEEESSEEEQAALALMATTDGASDDEQTPEAESDSEEQNEVQDEVLSPFSPHELKASLLEMLEKYNSLKDRYKALKETFAITSDKYEQTISELKENNFSLVCSNQALRSKISKLEEEVISNTSDSDNEKKYEKSFQYFLSKGVERSKMASLIYGVSRNNKKGLGYSGPQKENEDNNKKPKPLFDHFVPSGTEVRTSDSDQAEISNSQKRNKSSKAKPHAQVPLKYSKTRASQVSRTSGKANPKGPRRWVPKNQIIYLADILDSAYETPVMVPGQWLFATHDGRKAYVPKSGT